MLAIVILFVASMGGLLSKDKESRTNALKGALTFVGGVSLIAIVLQALQC